MGKSCTQSCTPCKSKKIEDIKKTDCETQSVDFTSLKLCRANRKNVEPFDIGIREILFDMIILEN